jgi:CHAT domain-containing protein
LLRKYVAEDLSIAKWLEQRRYGPMLDLLLVVNPTGDLPGAEAEGERIHDLFGGYSKVNITELRGAEAGKEALMQAFASGDYDAVHYAGHAFFDEKNPAESGIICHGHEVLRGADLSGVATLPALVFFNACEAARVRRGRDRRRTNLAVSKRVERTVGLAEAFLRGGVANYVGTYWPVGDAPAKRFAETFYTKLLEGASIGYALQDGRSELRSMKSVDWADYVHYGSFDFVLKTPE